ncbi:hypothetical protein BV25DRAFT_1996315 [Artomyces pyxidatus]|uniref:Uncharacterized protein n=1 Tax=Artomyces pyxidatus TaxID=48021 RepID=A0ACB8SG88_9AGAM|nr:hypothetical protein BV25DRAFT_1996315 [Artomyces pyxidatus]
MRLAGALSFLPHPYLRDHRLGGIEQTTFLNAPPLDRLRLHCKHQTEQDIRAVARRASHFNTVYNAAVRGDGEGVDEINGTTRDKEAYTAIQCSAGAHRHVETSDAHACEHHPRLPKSSPSNDVPQIVSQQVVRLSRQLDHIPHDHIRDRRAGDLAGDVGSDSIIYTWISTSPPSFHLPGAKRAAVGAPFVSTLAAFELQVARGAIRTSFGRKFGMYCAPTNDTLSPQGNVSVGPSAYAVSSSRHHNALALAPLPGGGLFGACGGPLAICSRYQLSADNISNDSERYDQCWEAAPRPPAPRRLSRLA